MHRYRSHSCDQHHITDIDTDVRLSGWLRNRRDLGGRVVARAAENINQELATGEIEVEVTELQLLPQRLWTGCQPDFLPARFRATEPGLPNSRLAIDYEHDDLGSVSPGIAIPVLALEPRWISPWAELVAGTASGWASGVAMFTGLMARQSADGVAAEAEPRPPSPRERLRRFRPDPRPPPIGLPCRPQRRSEERRVGKE